MKRFLHYTRHARLELFLVLLFIVQNQIFNSWAHLTPNPNIIFFVIESFTLGVFLYGPAIFFSKRLHFIYLFFISFLVSVFFIAQYIYFSFFKGFIQASTLEYARQVSSQWGTIFTLITPGIVIFLLNFFVVLSAFILEKKGKFRSALLYGKEKVAAIFIVCAVVIFGYLILIFANGNGLKQIANPLQTLHDLNSFSFSPDYLVQEVGIGNYFLADVIGAVMRNESITKDDIAFVQNWFSKKPAVVAGKYFGIDSGKNLFFIQIESLESAVIGQKIGNQEITPNLNKLTKEGLYFDNYYTQIGPGNTADAEFSTLNSLYPLTNEVAFIDFARNTYDALPDTLKESGYHTYALHGDVPDFWNRANIYPALGYENSISKEDFTTSETGFETLDDDDFFSDSIQKISTFDQPFMATLITLSSHSPFIIPENYQTIKFPANSTLNDTQKNYIESIHYMDGALGTFINKLKETGMYDKSLIAIYGDHGSFTDISGQLGTRAMTMTEGLRISRVPLILLSSKINSTLNGTTETPGSHLDLYPTVANLLGIISPQTILGQDLLNAKTPIITHRDPYSEIIIDILTSDLEYESAASGVFEEGICLKLPAKIKLPIEDCKKIYDEQSDTIRVSDLIVKGNLIPKL